MREQRRFPRVIPLQSRPVDVQILGHRSLEQMPAQDVSEGGVGILVGHHAEEYASDPEISLLIKLPGIKAFTAKGKVRHRRFHEGGGTLGIEFTEISESARLQIAAYVQQMLARGRRTA